MFKHLAAVFGIFCLVACGEPETQKTTLPETGSISETDRLNSWFEGRYEEELQFSPIEMTFLGRKDRYSEIDDFSEAAEDAFFAWQKSTVDTLKQEFDYHALSEEAQLSYDLWVYRYTIAERGRPFRNHDYIFEQMNGFHSFLPTFLMGFHAVDNADDMQAYVQRINGIAKAINVLVERAKKAASNGIRPPRFAYETVITESKSLVTGVPFDEIETPSPIWVDVQTKLEALASEGHITPEQSVSLINDAEAALTNAFKPAYDGLIAFIQADMQHTTELSQGVSALPNGEAYYSYLLERMTTTKLTPDEIHALGLSEVTRLRGEMEKVREQVGFKGDLHAFFALIRDSIDDNRFYYPDTGAGRQAYIDDAITAIENIKSSLPDYFGILPKAGLEVKRVEAFREQPGAAQHYYSGTPDGSRPGIYYAHLSDMTAMPKNQLEVIAYHEGLPGHHMQISIAQELQGIPTFRRQVGFTAYAEGWALYAEFLATEIPDTYIDPYSEFGRLSSEIWRAIRLVVDTGMHVKGWSEEQAVNYFAQNSPEPMPSIRSEVRRYLVIAGQATSYKVGMLDILRLREKSKHAFGEAFDIREFHDTILGGGSLPLGLLERRVDQWIAKTKPSLAK